MRQIAVSIIGLCLSLVALSNPADARMFVGDTTSFVTLGAHQEFAAIVQGAPLDAPLADRFKTSAAVLSEMKSDASTVAMVFEAMRLEQGLASFSSIWADAEIRKDWDRAQRWLEILGLASIIHKG